MANPQGQFKFADFFENDGGLNLTDSPFRMPDNQATGGYNYEYALTGGIRKRNGHSKQNSVADSQLKALGLGLHIAADGTKTLVRAAGTKIQKYGFDTKAFTNLSDDSSLARTDLLPGGSTQPVVNAHLDTGVARVLWLVGGGIGTGKVYGVYSGTKVTQNGAVAPQGALGATAGGAGGTITAGDYYYAISLHKASTSVESNANLDVAVTIAAGETVTLDFTTLVGLDTTRYDLINVYRSSVGGAEDFTAGTLVTQVASTATSYTDTGADDVGSVVVPRPGSETLDNSVLPAGTYNAISTYKRHLVVAQGSSVVFSEQDLPESWPVGNEIVVPSGGPITGLAVISFNTPTTDQADEFLAVFKERELWIITGNDFTDVQLKFVDQVGCPSQPLIATANGFLTWVDYSGVYLWDGSGKPIKCSRMINSLFDKDGDLDKPKLKLGFGVYYRKVNQVIWYLSHQVKGEQEFALKLDLRLTLPSVQQSMGGRTIDGVFIQDSTPFPVYSGLSFLPDTTYEESFLTGDDAGFMYLMNDGFADAASGIDFSYETKFFDFGSKGTVKRIHKIIVWTQDSSDAQLTLDWWTRYKADEDGKASMSQPASQQVSEALWDLAYWDATYWEQTVQAFNPIVFNLSSSNGSTEGDCLKLRFRQSDANAPITVAGFTVIYTDMAVRK